MKYIIILIIVVIITLFIMDNPTNKTSKKELDKKYDESQYATAILAGGCFWCVESDFEKIPDVIDVISGYSGGTSTNPTYEDSHDFGHKEVVKVIYDPNKTSYADLVAHLLRHIDPVDGEGSFHDRGQQYTSTIYYSSQEEAEIAQRIIDEINISGRFDKPIATTVEPRQEFYKAEDYHQDYKEKNPLRYSAYRAASGRDKYINTHWSDEELDEFVDTENDAAKAGQGLEAEGFREAKIVNNASTDYSLEWSGDFVKPSDEELKNLLSPVSYKVTQEEGTEKPFTSPLNDEKREGIFVDIISGEPLFSSLSKYDSGTGWPSFSQPIAEDLITENVDKKLFSTRTEVRSKIADSHLGHVFDDGPDPTGLRYCLNGAALRFVPREEMTESGYGEYLSLFEK